MAWNRRGKHNLDTQLLISIRGVMQNATLLSKLCGLLVAQLEYGETDIVAAIKCCSFLIENWVVY
jgi:hypothetical protein